VAKLSAIMFMQTDQWTAILVFCSENRVDLPQVDHGMGEGASDEVIEGSGKDFGKSRQKSAVNMMHILQIII
jgi:hypothetical protein